jgi:hypothetical protein
MAGQGNPAADKLRDYLRALKPGAQALLIAELERGLLQGTASPGAELILSELRRSIRANQSRSPRFSNAARLFFQPLEPFLVDDVPNHRHRGRIARQALEPLWLWIANGLLPAEAKSFAEQVEQALAAGDSEKAEHDTETFQDCAAARITQILEGADDKYRRRLSSQLGSSRGLDDVQALRGILNSRDSLATFGIQLPDNITALTGPLLESLKAQLDSSLAAKSDLFLYSLLLLMSRLASPWQLIRLAIKAAGSDDAKRMADTPYAVAVQIVLEEVDRRVRELGTDLKSGRGIAVAALLKEVHDSLRGLRSEINLSSESAWGKQLATLRTEISKVLTAEIELMPGRVRRLIRPRPSKEIASASRVDAQEVAETEALIGFVAACRNYASELAINEVTQRTFSELQQFLDSGTRALLDALRAASPGERPFRQSQVDAAVRFCAKVFGQEYASLLAKAAEVALHDQERKAPARA